MDVVQIYKDAMVQMLAAREANDEQREESMIEVLDDAWEKMTGSQHAEVETWLPSLKLSTTC